MTNLLLKVNVKCGGRNFKVLPHPSTFVGNKRCIFFGADVTHPDAGDADSPSLAAVVASNDWPDTGRFLALQSEQGHRVEILQNLQSLAEELMRKWSERNNFTAPDVCDHFSLLLFHNFF
jgi:eukaryotic translation initiation factor 2C